MDQISVIIPTFNEEKTLEEAILSVIWADELIIVDSFSTDNTLSIAKKYTSRILQHKYENSANQKNRIIPLAKHNWIFILDADERVTPSLAKEIKTVLKKAEDQYDAYWICRDNYFMEKRLRFTWRGDKVIRLFKKEKGVYQNLNVHSELMVAGQSGRLKSKLIHLAYSGGLAKHLKKLDRYTTWGAKDRIEKVKNVTMFHLMIKPLYRFLKHYVLFLGFLDGKAGFIVSVFSSYTVFLRSVKLWRLKKGENLDPM